MGVGHGVAWVLVRAAYRVGIQNGQIDLWACVFTDQGLRVAMYQKKDLTSEFVMRSDDVYSIGFYQPLQFSSDTDTPLAFATIDVKNQLHIWYPFVGGVEVA